MQNTISHSRRDFLKTSAMLSLAGVSAAFIPNLLQGAQNEAIIHHFCHTGIHYALFAVLFCALRV